MDDVVDLGDSSQFPSSQLQEDADGSCASGFNGSERVMPTGAGGSRPGGRSSGIIVASRLLQGGFQSQSAVPHILWRLNWTEAEMLVLIGQNHIEWDGRHNCSQSSLAKFMYGTTAWKMVFAGCMTVVGFRVRDADQLTNKWDGLIKDYKKLKEYIEDTGSANWWGMNRDEKRELCKTRRLPLKFSETMVHRNGELRGETTIFGRTADFVDSDRLSSPPNKTFGHSPPSPRTAAYVGAGSPASSATTAPPPYGGYTWRRLPDSTGRKRKAVGTDNLVHFVNDFNYDYLARVESQ